MWFAPDKPQERTPEHTQQEVGREDGREKAENDMETPSIEDNGEEYGVIDNSGERQEQEQQSHAESAKEEEETEDEEQEKALLIEDDSDSVESEIPAVSQHGDQLSFGWPVMCAGFVVLSLIGVFGVCALMKGCGLGRCRKGSEFYTSLQSVGRG